jgi:hypothetical protein
MPPAVCADAPDVKKTIGSQGRVLITILAECTPDLSRRIAAQIR